jgi:probable rRNA maturation factor
LRNPVPTRIASNTGMRITDAKPMIMGTPVVVHPLSFLRRKTLIRQMKIIRGILWRFKEGVGYNIFVDVKVYRDGIKTPKGLVSALEMFLRGTARREGIRSRLSVIITGDERMAWLNETFRGRKGPTDVLAFPDEDLPEIYLSWDEAVRRGDPAGECARLALHGLLHIAGYDHKDKDSAAEMRRLEEEYLLCWIF